MAKWADETVGNSNKKFLQRRQACKLDAKLVEQLIRGVALACISSRPGQSGRADGYLLEGRELEFYLRKLERK